MVETPIPAHFPAPAPKLQSLHPLPPVHRRKRHLALVQVRDVEFTAADGFPLRGTLFVNPAGAGPAILVNSAIAVSRQFYAKFAQAAASAGAAAVLTYDYRGTGGSARPQGWKKRLAIRDWASLDLPAAATFLQHKAGAGTPLAAIGQSIGGSMFCLSGVANRFCRHVMVSTGHGWFGNTDEPLRLFCRLNLAARPVAALLGYAPAWLGAGMRMPRSLLDDWGRYASRRSYLFDPRDVPEAAHCERVRTPTLALGFTDDTWTTRRAVDAIVARLPAAPVTQKWIDPADYGETGIGHLGFFRTRFTETLWPAVIDWLIAGPLPVAR